MAYEFVPGEDVRHSISRTAREQLDRAIGVLTEELETDPVDAVHTARKAIKKERALLRMARGAIPRIERRYGNVVLRDAARNLSSIRDAEVAVQTFEQLAERFAGQLPESTFAAVREQLERDRSAERERAAELAVHDEAINDLRLIRSRAESWELRRDGWEAVAPGVERSYTDGRAAMRLVRGESSVGNLHNWRKRVKDLWYELRLLAPVCGPTVRGGAEEAEHLSDLLGDDHDLAVLREILVGKAPHVRSDLDALIGLVDYRRDQLQTQAKAIGARLYAEKPRAFVRRMQRLWEAGRAEYRAFEGRHPAALAQPTRPTEPGVSR
jgi:CHAD domain-containing protein